MIFLNRWQGVLLAFLMMVLLAGRLEPLAGIHQLDFWLVWLVSMVVLALPVLLLESALAKRTKALPLQALPALTRDADVSPRWRIVGWLAILGVLLLAGSLAAQVGTLVNNAVAVYPNQQLLPANILKLLPFIILIVALVLSYIPKGLPIFGVALLLGVVGVDLTQGVSLSAWQWTAFTWVEWSSVVVLALASTGLGLGLYWASALTQQTKGQGDTPRRAVLPIWLTQVIAGFIFALGLTTTQGANTATTHVGLAVTLYALATLIGAGILLSFARQQLMARDFNPMVTSILILVSLAVWVLPIQDYLLTAAIVVTILITAIYAIFSGWKMKSSHLRKALNFNNEALYNVWRVQIRILVPLAVVLAIVGLIGQYV
ncbi:hypothetical protein [Aquirhabdus parva]|uniref:Uncharacterized protein n=1 Tax=Aquirhabdus parva TaxID=2283318 RepID=A0A345P3M6_9GAMM|nr:hypothetical protein [Aquirhabdus parva]AXI01885.1 hypothetical protein HYN46_02710 [Aquirhabdus parva]